jgi:hypothetical protein
MGVTYECYLLPRPVSFRPSSADVVRLVEELRRKRWLPSRSMPEFEELTSRFPGSAAGMARRTVRFLPKQYPRDAGLELLPDPLTPAWLDAHPGTALLWEVHEATLLPDDALAEIESLFGVRYALSRIDDLDPDPYYTFTIRWSDHFLEPFGDSLETWCRSICACGGDFEDELPLNLPDGSCQRGPFSGNRYLATCPGCGRPFDADAETTEEDGYTREKRVIGEGGAVHRFAIHVDCDKSHPHGPPQLRFHPDFIALCANVLGCTFVEVGTFG